MEEGDIMSESEKGSKDETHDKALAETEALPEIKTEEDPWFEEVETGGEEKIERGKLEDELSDAAEIIPVEVKPEKVKVSKTTCPWCGKEFSIEEYLKHYDVCSVRVGEPEKKPYLMGITADGSPIIKMK